MKDKSPDYNAGYGQCKADVLLSIKEALAFIEVQAEALFPLDLPPELRLQRTALRWVRSMIKKDVRNDNS